ncbi:substrate-binding domain-containing protein [Mesorhizobium sp. M1163]|uniref:substrate-binding domain-containing protein n=1 Tax=Mesorhizobium sp. M1163 TaxID=2957065 RepID=UPI00333DB5BF
MKKAGAVTLQTTGRAPSRCQSNAGLGALLGIAVFSSGWSEGCPTRLASAAASESASQTIIMLNGPLADPYFGAMKQGSDAAAEALGISYQYAAPSDIKNFVPDYTTLINQAIGRKPDAIVIGNFVPSAFDPLIKKASVAGIPVVVVNTGLNTWQEDGAIGFVGFVPEGLGAAAGGASLQAGVRHLLCINHAPVNPTLGVRCKAARERMAAAGGTVDELNIPFADSGNPAAVTQTIQGYLLSHSEIDGVLALGSAIANNAVVAVQKAGKTGKVTIGTVTLSSSVLDAIANGEITYAVDEQPFLQGFYGIAMASQYARYKVHPTAPILTGGLVIDKTNVNDVIAIQKQFPGLRGAE